MTARPERSTRGGALGDTRGPRLGSHPRRAELSPAEPRPTAVLATGVAGAVLLAAGGLLPVVQGGSADSGGRWLLLVLALLPAAIAIGFAAAGRASAAVSVLAGAAALAPGRVLLDLQFAADSSLAQRPELYLPTTIEPRSPAAGLWLLLAGHLAVLVAGWLAVRTIRDEVEAGGEAPAPRWMAFTALVVGFVAAVGLMMAPFHSADANLLSGSAFDGPFPALAGFVLLACAVPLAGVLAAGTGLTEITRGGLLGLAAAVLAVSLPAVYAGAGLPVLTVGAGPVVAAVAALGLVLLGFAGTTGAAEPSPGTRRERFAPAPTVRAAPPTEVAEVDQVRAGSAVLAARAMNEGDSGSPAPRSEVLANEARLPGRRNLELLTAGSAVLTAVAAVLGALTPQLISAAAAPVPESPSRLLLLLTGLFVGVLGLVLFLPGPGTLARPALSAAWVTVPLAGTAALQSPITAIELSASLSAGPGVVWAAVAMVLAVVTACFSVVAGMVERDAAADAETTGPVARQRSRATSASAPSSVDTRPTQNLLTPVVAAAILAIGAFGMPAVSAPDYDASGLWTHFDSSWWGLLLGLLTVLGALGLATRSRPARAAALLLGAAAVAGARVAELPVTGGSIEGLRAASGHWLALGCVVALLVAAVLAATGRGRTAE